MAQRRSSESAGEASRDWQRTEYMEERRLLIEAELSQSSSFDKYVLVLSSGALALSLTVIGEVVPSPKPSTYPFLVLAWLSFALVIASTLTAMLLSQKALQHQRDIYDEAIRKDDWPPTQHTPLSRWVGRCNWLSLACFVMGAVLLSVFAAVNLPWCIGE